MIILTIKLILIAACGLLWRLGGSDEFSKGVRRYGCSGLIMTSLIISQNWLGLISIPFLIGAFSLGYGESSTLTKWLKNKYLVRWVCGLAYSVASLPIFWGNWHLLGYHIFVCSIGVLLAGNQKFNWEDLREESFVGLCVGWLPILG